jgi:ribonucleotide monophosphatase NagD (HAD superfamily)
LIFATEAMTARAKNKKYDKVPVKPSRLLLNFALEECRERVHIAPTISDTILRMNTVAIGDDLTRDGMGALFSQLDFVLIQGNEKQQEEAWRLYARKLLGLTVCARKLIDGRHDKLIELKTM